MTGIAELFFVSTFLVWYKTKDVYVETKRDFVIKTHLQFGDFVMRCGMSEVKLKRKIYDELLKWKNEYATEYALFIKGAKINNFQLCVTRL